MSRKVLLDKPLRVDSADFLHLGVAIEALDEVISSEPELQFSLEYPFEKPYAGTVRAPSGATRRQVIEAIRDGFRTMYAATTAKGGPYGRAHQQLDHLFVDRIELSGTELQVEATT